MGRSKIRIEKIQDERVRKITFEKRKRGLMKKAIELSILCDTEVFLSFMDTDRKCIIYHSLNQHISYLDKFVLNFDYSRRFICNESFDSDLSIFKDDGDEKQSISKMPFQAETISDPTILKIKDDKLPIEGCKYDSSSLLFFLDSAQEQKKDPPFISNQYGSSLISHMKTFNTNAEEPYITGLPSNCLSIKLEEARNCSQGISKPCNYKDLFADIDLSFKRNNSLTNGESNGNNTSAEVLKESLEHKAPISFADFYSQPRDPTTIRIKHKNEKFTMLSGKRASLLANDRESNLAPVTAKFKFKVLPSKEQNAGLKPMTRDN